MHRRPLLELLARYAPIDAEDAARRARFRAFIEAHPDCLERSLSIGHVTGSAWIVDPSGRDVLLTHHAKLDIWVQPGGHADGDPDLLAVALREAREETGLPGLAPVGADVFDLDIHPIPGRGPIPRHEHYDVRFALRAAGGVRFVVTPESHALAWTPLDRLEERTREPSLLRMRDKWAALVATS